MHLCVYTYVCLHMCVYVYMHMCVYVTVYAYVYVCMHMCVCMCVRVCMCTRTHARTHHHEASTHVIIGSAGDVSCFSGEGCAIDQGGDCGGRDCYALAFGIPAILMTIAIIIFIAGSHMYITNKPPGGNNIFFMFFDCLWVCCTYVLLLYVLYYCVSYIDCHKEQD